MPLYDYKCPVCDQQVELLIPMLEYQSEQPCTCGAVMQRIFTTKKSHSPNFRKPIEMFSVAPTSPQELEAFRRKCPDVELTRQLVPIAHNRTEKKQILRAVGFEEKS